MPPDLPMFKAGPMSTFPDAEFGNRADTLAADIPAGGKTSARAIARLYAALLGEVDGVRLLTPERLREVTAVASSGTDEVFGMPTTWGLGYGIGGPGGERPEAPTVFGYGGVGGSFACGDTASGVAWAVTKNRVSNDFATATQLGGLITGAVAPDQPPAPCSSWKVSLVSQPGSRLTENGVPGTPLVPPGRLEEARTSPGARGSLT